MTMHQQQEIVAAFETALGGRALDGNTIGDVMAKIEAALPGVTLVEVQTALKANAEHLKRVAAQWEKIDRLCRATGLPKGKPIFRWLIKHGLIVETPRGDLMFTPKASLDSRGTFEPLIADDGAPARLSDRVPVPLE